MSLEDQVWTVEDAISFLKRQGIYEEAERVQAVEIGDGNLNYVFRARSADRSKGVIVKKAVPFLRVVGETWPLTEERASIEAAALRFQNEVASGYVPEVYAYSPADHAIAMEDLSNLEVMRSALMKGEQFPLFNRHVAEFLARTLFWSSDRSGKITEKKERAAAMVNPQLCEITERLILSEPFYDAPGNRIEKGLEEDVEGIWEDAEVIDNVFLLKDRFMSCGQALLHGDLHTGSIMIDQAQTRMIDPEFAFYGPIGFDPGLLFANLVLNMIHHEVLGHSPSHREYLLSAIVDIWARFTDEFCELWRMASYDGVFHNDRTERSYILGILRDTCGYAGCEIIRRTIGLASVADLADIQDDKARIMAKKASLAVGSDLIKLSSGVESIDELVAVAKGVDISPVVVPSSTEA